MWYIYRHWTLDEAGEQTWHIDSQLTWHLDSEQNWWQRKEKTDIKYSAAYLNMAWQGSYVQQKEFLIVAFKCRNGVVF